MTAKIKVALFVKPTAAPLERERRNMGYWSYPVMQFEWVHFSPHMSTVETKRFNEFDLIFWEDGGTYKFVKNGGPAVVYMAIDSTLSGPHYHTRLERSKQADLVLVDHDRLERFAGGAPVRRLGYCVNDLVFEPVKEKKVDVAYHCSSGARKGMPGGYERNELRRKLDDVCAQTYSYRSGALGLADYARSLAEARVAVNWPRTIINRPHRVLDVMACRTALLTGPIPSLECDLIEEGVHYYTFEEQKDVGAYLQGLLENERWESMAQAGYDLVMEQHTWAMRAAQLRQLLKVELGI